MKRNILVVILIFAAFFGVYGQNTSPIDLVLVLDTSSAMSSSYENVSDYITGAFLNEFLRVGDTFHLIAISGNQRLDVARRILGAGDVETIIGRMLLQYPVENSSNIGAALTFAERYVTTLPARAKKIVFVTVGGSDTNNLVGASRQRLSSRNTTIDFVQVTPGQPLANVPSSGRARPAVTQTQRPGATSPSTTATTGTGTGTSAGTTTGSGSTTTATTPGRDSTTSTGTTRDTTTTVGGTTTTGTSAGTGTTTTTTSGRDSTTSTGTTRDTTTTGDITATGTTTTGDSTASGVTTTGGSADDSTVSGSSTQTSSTVSGAEKGEKKSIAFSMPFIIGLIILILLILGLIIFFASRRLGSSPNRVMAEVASSGSRKKDTSDFVDHSKELASYASGQSRRSTPYDNRPIKVDKEKQPVINPSAPLLLNFFVEDQNTAIGKRNIHSLKSGYGLSVGGGKADDFLIFLVPIPTGIGEIRRNGGSLTFIPKKPKYFPDTGSSEIRDCINKTIRIVSDKDYEMRFRFEMYEDPLLSLNRTLMSIKVPG